MRQAVEFIGFAAVAAVVHLVVFSAAPDGGPEVGGGEDTISLAAASWAISAMVDDWDRPVEAFQQSVLLAPVMPSR
ncbi:hypothetical protein [Yoonia sp. MH D7]